jgi:hypothetical protein
MSQDKSHKKMDLAGRIQRLIGDKRLEGRPESAQAESKSKFSFLNKSQVAVQPVEAIKAEDPIANIPKEYQEVIAFLKSQNVNPATLTMGEIFVDPNLSPTLLPLFRKCAADNFMPETVAFYEEYLALRQAAQPDFMPSLLLSDAENSRRRGATNASNASNASTANGSSVGNATNGMIANANNGPVTSTPRNPEIEVKERPAKLTLSVPENSTQPGESSPVSPAVDSTVTLDRAQIKSLVERFVDPKSPQCLNIQGSLRNSILDASNPNNPTGPTVRQIDLVGKQVGQSILGNLLPRFRMNCTIPDGGSKSEKDVGGHGI